jgi:hypothetical protein
MKKNISAILLFVLFFVITSSISASTTELYNGKARWQRLKGAKYYNVYYRLSGSKKFNHAVSHLSKDTDDFSIKHLIIGQTYEYRISAVDKYGREVWITGILPLKRIN